jgi:hypothetical protein
MPLASTGPTVNAGTGNANSISYAGPSGKQHVAIVAGETVRTFALP